MTRKEEKRKQANKGYGPPGKNGFKLIVYCPECFNMKGRETLPTPVRFMQKDVTCGNNHVFQTHR